MIFSERRIQGNISNPENPTGADIKKILNILPNELDETLIQEYYNFVAAVIPSMLKTINDLASQSLGKDVINSFNKRIDTLNKRFETENNTEVLIMIQQEISDLYDRIEKESDKQREWLMKLAFGAIGTVAILGGIAISVKNKEAGKKIIEEGMKVLRG